MVCKGRLSGGEHTLKINKLNKEADWLRDLGTIIIICCSLGYIRLTCFPSFAKRLSCRKKAINDNETTNEFCCLFTSLQQAIQYFVNSNNNLPLVSYDIPLLSAFPGHPDENTSFPIQAKYIRQIKQDLFGSISTS